MVFQDQTKQRSFLIAAAIICAFLQIGLAPHVHLFNAHPNFSLIFAGVAMAVLPGASSVLCGFFAGVFFDLTGVGPFGLMAFSLSLMNFLCGIDNSKRMGESWQETYRLFCIGAAAVEFITLIGEFIAGAPSFTSFFLGAYLFAVLLDCLFALPLFVVCGKLTSTASTGAGTSGVSKYAEKSYAIDSPTQITPASFESIGPSGRLLKKKKRLLDKDSGMGSVSEFSAGFGARSRKGGRRGARSFGARSLDGGRQAPRKGSHFLGPRASQKKRAFQKRRGGGKNSLGGGFR